MNPWRWVDPRVAGVRVADIRAYFLARSWKFRPNPNPNLLRFEAPAESGEPPIFQMIPASERAADYRQRVVELITTLSELEDRHPLTVLEEMLAAGQPHRDGKGASRSREETVRD
jgi:hypothetical protein